MRRPIAVLNGYTMAAVGATCLMLDGWCTSALAKPEAPSLFCGVYSDAYACMGAVPECAMCHVSTFPPAWNAYGLAIQAALDRQISFDQALPGALASVESLDSDSDGYTNMQEIRAGTLPGDSGSFLDTPEQTSVDLPSNPEFAVGTYDIAFAYKRASILYCGHSPSYEDMRPFRDPAVQTLDRSALMHQRIDDCLGGGYWLGEGLPRLADDRIRPIRNLGQDSQVFLTIPIATPQPISLRSVMGDYSFDYRLWVYALSGNRDARDLLLAQYFVLQDADGSWRLTEDVIPNTDPTSTAGGQRLEKPYRAGMITTMWFLARNTMFTALPRTTAAAAYRAYLGADISKQQGIMPVPGEPADVDGKGVGAPRCAACHSTLDPMAYAFMKYRGLDDAAAITGLLQTGQADSPFGTYDENRPTERIPNWSSTQQQPMLFGQPVDSLREWAEKAAASDEFARNLADIFYRHALGRDPSGADFAEFTALWKSLPDDGYSANRLIHRLIDTRAFGAP